MIWDSIFNSRMARRPLIIGVAIGLTFPLMRTALSEENIGDATVVLHDVRGGERPLAQGDNVFLNEAVRSEADSKANLTLKDNTNVTVGPSSVVTLDSFVYSGPKAPGTIGLNLAKGTFRFVTGDASKKSYTIVTPSAAIGVRGTILRIRVTDTETKVVNEEGIAIVCHRNRGDPASVEELRKRKCRKEDEKKGRCGCTELSEPNQEATVSPGDQISVTEAPPGEIPEPIITAGVPPILPPLLIGGGLVGLCLAADCGNGGNNNNNPMSP